jgi:protein-S-isoprenylcysteine O-methyltransferase Ste14
MTGLGIPERLVVTGPFAVVRHPSSIGVLFILGGWYLMWRALHCLCWALPVVVIAILVENELEERNLEKAFGDEYRDYKKRVGRYFPKMARLRG